MTPMDPHPRIASKRLQPTRRLHWHTGQHTRITCPSTKRITSSWQRLLPDAPRLREQSVPRIPLRVPTLSIPQRVQQLPLRINLDAPRNKLLLANILARSPSTPTDSPTSGIRAASPHLMRMRTQVQLCSPCLARGRRQVAPYTRG